MLEDESRVCARALCLKLSTTRGIVALVVEEYIYITELIFPFILYLLHWPLLFIGDEERLYIILFFR